MVKYGIVCIMKITLTIPDIIYEKLEKDRGIVPRSTYIQDLINCFGSGVGSITPQHILGKSNDVYGNHPPEEKRKLEGQLKKLIKNGVVKKGVKELPSQDTGGFKTYFKK